MFFFDGVKLLGLKVYQSEHRRAGFYDMLAEASKFGLGDCLAISSATGDGMADLYNLIYRSSERVHDAKISNDENDDIFDSNFILKPVATNVDVDFKDSTSESPAELIMDREPLQFAIIGKPNVGKSTLLNRLVGDQRVRPTNQ